ncbi:UDP-N-acetylmuramoyl-L-alanine--D-glutamate ligase [Chamaesiphon polymorphus]|uniref:UDP-N-acetylmuramoylalanine--D-glutamate ligase n=1 Tax=Chamaesiphon polymorphus CCALA 037 TaxID=2107692 RepID=A0A2T1GG40_9CYAN|nr:UDP-N-acetylmuramoyl-L-alanine--D-glutamate ligase [Chamaesiphon polymorphus]PSB56566.1 UDP-N-acetylmuramoyl-L-alanine--D-glutamate ligase [Chamaesiphon polymorphus CCALA 037]
MKKATVIGLGRSGIAAAKLLTKHGYSVTLSDSNSNPNLEAQKQQLELLNINVKLGDKFTPTDEDTIVVSPGVPWDIAPLVTAREMGIDTIGEMELAWRYLQDLPWVAITGTNGKTTTTALTAAIFQAAGIETIGCGNIGFAACELALLETHPAWIIAEMSSYQIESTFTLKPQIGVWTTLTPDHLARHKTVTNYAQIKAKLLRSSHHQILNGDDRYLHDLGESDWQNATWTSVEGKQYLRGNPEAGIWIEDNWVVFRGERVLQADSLKMPGDHNRQNMLMAVAIAKLAGIDNDAIANGVASFPGVAHRLEYICTHEGVDYINDSKATNYDAADVGLTAVKAPVILIAGGEAKEGDDLAWLETIKQKAAAVLLIGSAATQFADRLTSVGYTNFEIVETMANAVARAPELAKRDRAKVVLLSPACASFDQYTSFEHRGDDFRQLCQALSTGG